MIEYPLVFNVNGEATSGMKEAWCSSSGNREVTLSVPECFEGSGAGLSPEDLYAMSLLNCFLGTFKVYAEKSRLTYDKIDGKAKLYVDRDEKGTPWMKRIEFEIELREPSDQKKAERLFERVENGGMILNSVKTELEFSFKLSPRAD